MSFEIVDGPNTGMHPFGAEQTWWVISVEGKPYMVSYVDRAFDTGRAECMAFECDEDGMVLSFKCVAVSYEKDLNLAFNEAIAELERLCS